MLAAKGAKNLTSGMLATHGAKKLDDEWNVRGQGREESDDRAALSAA